jgi:hypothetical protein
MQKVRRQGLSPLRLIVSTRFHVLFHSPLGVLFTFPSQYLSTIGHKKYSGLEDGPPIFKQNFTCSVLLDKQYQIYLHGTVTLYS